MILHIFLKKYKKIFSSFFIGAINAISKKNQAQKTFLLKSFALAESQGVCRWRQTLRLMWCKARDLENLAWTSAWAGVCATAPKTAVIIVWKRKQQQQQEIGVGV